MLGFYVTILYVTTIYCGNLSSLFPLQEVDSALSVEHDLDQDRPVPAGVPQKSLSKCHPPCPSPLIPTSITTSTLTARTRRLDPVTECLI